jgi:type IV pilus assembly protein PilN
MIRINLLPFRAARKKENIRRQVSFFLLFFGLVAVGLLLAHLYMGNWVKSLQAQTKRVNIEIKRYEEIGKQVDENKKKIEVINKKKNVINSLVKDRYKPVRLLGVLTELIIADQMWLTSLSTQGSGVRIKGIAMDERTVADFMTNLENSGLFAVVNLSTVKQKIFDDAINLKEFEVACKSSMPKPVQDKSKQGQKK